MKKILSKVDEAQAKINVLCPFSNEMDHTGDKDESEKFWENRKRDHSTLGYLSPSEFEILLVLLAQT